MYVECMHVVSSGFGRYCPIRKNENSQLNGIKRPRMGDVGVVHLRHVGVAETRSHDVQVHFAPNQMWVITLDQLEGGDRASFSSFRARKIL